MIQTKLIGYAVALARHGNFAKAADSLGLSQPSLSRNIAALEAQVGVKLFDRGPKGVVPNAFGHVLLQRGETLIETEESLLRELQLLGGLEHGRLVIGAGPYPADISVGTTVARLVAAHPRLKIRVIIDGPEEIRRAETVCPVKALRAIVGTTKGVQIASVLPPAIANSSSVPITRSNSGRIACRCAVTVSLAMKRVSPSPRLVSPHSTGR